MSLLAPPPLWGRVGGGVGAYDDRLGWRAEVSPANLALPEAERR